MPESDRARESDIPEPAIVDVQDWPPRSRSDDAREELDRQVGTLGVTAAGGPEGTIGDDPGGTSATPPENSDAGGPVMGTGPQGEPVPSDPQAGLLDDTTDEEPESARRLHPETGGLVGPS
jgi:hypothetical protein